ncbi:hypothetical protein GSH05_00445 [Burkholderia pseudomallei]|uniref:Uncharacterized protein n=2 Tax=Burkholderia mallei TaxID=13373 RepID=A0AAX1XCM2_BURML|nr:hypothetical protein BMAA0825 [Burkholderia mallei ATCC 23344]MBM5591238.1 hypothetical protein [Burkholderia pseudomallei]RKN96471.1 hypothetical protein D8O31_17265 [Burkholderia mallei]MBM5650179.1 hypothetical protein [Burkholderia pseudomallei]PJO58117.1 hypothetical protein CWD85_17755 [Burkholderia pseudomallei]
MQRSNAPRPCEDGRRSCAARLSIECPATHAALPGRRRAAHGRVRRRLADHASRAPSGAGGRGQKFSCNACRFRRNPFVVTIERARASGALDR